MRMSQGVEWAVHTLLNLAWLGTNDAVPTAALAASHDLSATYLNKQLQLLVKAELLSSAPGKRGGFRLTRPPESITMLDVVDAIEGRESLFRCAEIRQCGTLGSQSSAIDFTTSCAVKSSMARAEVAWREALASQTLADVKSAAEAHAPTLGSTVQRVLGRD
ncbi:Rrf2 family transcriptional regulator [Rhodococcus sp. G-MC3]|uniref:RrF2 family transcriptional regulator n=1 Tax=Rhodococcus sp. G-MC3 TaxID=3046209 RepID=UPI0024BB8E76|nr:Rrf2 family transcriptional regulator [Rhodococcus sp. G-MC3]MDJ0396235.1 Rrf2 family transcriptional regulator [Rhodococcus sp. G-MC3]